MDSYEKIIQIIRKEFNRMNQNQIRIAVMSGPTSCRMNHLDLDKEDLLFSEHLLNGKLKNGDMVLVVKISEEKFAVIEKLVEV